MPEGLYCKAYRVRDFRKFPEWHDDGVTVVGDLDDVSAPARPIEDDDVLFLHEDYSVTDGLFSESKTVFADGDEEWRAFCRDTLEFSVPDDLIAARELVDRDLVAEER